MYTHSMVINIVHIIQELHCFAIELMLGEFEPPLDKNQPAANLRQWLNRVRLSQNVIETVLSLSSQNDILSDAR